MFQVGERVMFRDAQGNNLFGDIRRVVKQRWSGETILCHICTDDGREFVRAPRVCRALHYPGMHVPMQKREV